MISTIAYIALGSNLDKPVKQVTAAITQLSRTDHTQVLAQSPLYQSPPMGPQDQDNFVNAVVKVVTHLSPFQLLDYTQSIEQMHGRVKERHWGPRTIDLDILLYGDSTIYSNSLNIPHAGIKDRDFVLKPLLDIDADLCLPDGSAVKDLLAQLPDSCLKPVDHEYITT